jgi:hypothetical protein
VARGCARIDSWLDTAKIGSDGRVDVDYARLRAVLGEEKRFHTAWTQNGNGLRRTFANNSALRHPGDAHTLIDALPAGKINGVVTRYGGAITAYRKSRIERKSCLRGSPRLALRSE